MKLCAEDWAEMVKIRRCMDLFTKDWSQIHKDHTFFSFSSSYS